MKKNYANVVGVFFLFTSLTSCNTGRNSLDSMFGEPTNIYCKEVISGMALGRPYALRKIDSYILLADNMDGKLVTIYDVDKNKVVNRLFSEGQGPNELSHPIHIEIDRKNKEVGILQRQNSIFTQYKLPTLLRDSIHMVRKINFESSAQQCIETDWGCAAVGFYEDGLIGLYNPDGNLVSVTNAYPDYLNEVESTSDKYRIGQGKICYNEAQKSLAFASSFSGEMRFYQLSNTNTMKLIRSFSIASDFKERVHKNAKNVPILGTDVEHCTDVCSTKDFFYILYSGVSMEQRQAAKHSYILKYSADGKPIKRFRTDSKFYRICSDEVNDELYGITLSKEQEYIVVKIDGLN